MNFMERMEVDAEQKQAFSQVTLMRQNEEHRKALLELMKDRQRLKRRAKRVI